jgi:hypothetical protein
LSSRRAFLKVVAEADTEGVELVRTIEGDPGDLVADVVEQVLVER